MNDPIIRIIVYGLVAILLGACIFFGIGVILRILIPDTEGLTRFMTEHGEFYADSVIPIGNDCYEITGQLDMMLVKHNGIYCGKVILK